VHSVAATEITLLILYGVAPKFAGNTLAPQFVLAPVQGSLFRGSPVRPFPAAATNNAGTQGVTIAGPSQFVCLTASSSMLIWF
jgi:hypothetical protein